jgi:ABC-type multidrug transport system permease subunit
MSDFDYWSVNGINSLLNVPQSIAYNSTFFYDSVVSDLIESICAYSRRQTLKCIMLYLDDARPHNSRQSTECLEQFRACIVPHPDYSPGLEPSNFFFLLFFFLLFFFLLFFFLLFFLFLFLFFFVFFFFGPVKSKLPGLAIRSREYLIYEIQRIFQEIPKVTLISIYTSWIKQFK